MNWNNLVQLYGYQMFDNIVLNKNLDKEILINTIMDKCALTTPVWPELDILTMKINNFFKKNELLIDKLYRAYIADFNLIDNYDRTEEHTVTRQGDNVVKVSPYDNNNFINDSKNENNDITTTKSHIYGNIGTISPAEMLEKNMRVFSMINVYENIANMFFDEFCIYVM